MNMQLSWKITLFTEKNYPSVLKHTHTHRWNKDDSNRASFIGGIECHPHIREYLLFNFPNCIMMRIYIFVFFPHCTALASGQPIIQIYRDYQKKPLHPVTSLLLKALHMPEISWGWGYCQFWNGLKKKKGVNYLKKRKERNSWKPKPAVELQCAFEIVNSCMV